MRAVTLDDVAVAVALQVGRILRDFASEALFEQVIGCPDYFLVLVVGVDHADQAGIPAAGVLREGRADAHRQAGMVE